MVTVTVSSKYQVVIPKEIRNAMRIRPGQRMNIMALDGRIELIPDRDVRDLKGFLKGILTGLERDEDRY